VHAGKLFGIPVMGTAAHMWTMAHTSEEEAFANYVETFPNAAILLIDTYDTLRGAERAARIARDKLKGVRLDSGDLLGLSKAVRTILDAQGCKSAKIVASGDLNEYKIAALRSAGAPIDLYGVGTDLVASLDSPSLGGVYKLVEIEQDGKLQPTCKFSENKATFPGPHQVFRFLDAEEKIAKDVIALADEDAGSLGNGKVETLLVPRMKAGLRTSPPDDLNTIRARVRIEMARLPETLQMFDEAPEPSERWDEPFKAKPSARLLELIESVRSRMVGVAR
jgi:nicotinate phosphoribosyltransferase